jgi:hypothetical protein
MIPDDEHLYLDVKQLYERGWTETLIKNFLVSPDRMKSVDHWQNYTGKRCYFLGRVEETESEEDFKRAFVQSVRKRKLRPKVIEAMILSRKSTEGQVRQFADSLSERDQVLQNAINKYAAVIRDARNHGYRTPHK